jgi:DNA-binding beta-propeller fold protein YncE
VGSLGVAAKAVEFEWLPVTASGDHTLNGNQIFLDGGGQTVTLHYMVSGWDPGSIGTLLGSFQGTIDSATYLGANACPPNPSVDLYPHGQPLSPEDGAFQALQICANIDCVNDPTSPACIWDPLSNCPGIACVDPLLYCHDRYDWVFAGGDYHEAVNTNSLSYYWFAASTTCAADPNDGITKFYAGTLILEVPLGARGTYSVGFDDEPNFTLATDCVGGSLSDLTLVPARITISCETNADCGDCNDCTDDVCNVGGICTHTNLAEGTACTDDGDGCTDDRCDGSGLCTHPYALAGSSCGDPSDTDCTDPDICDGVGTCLSRNAPAGTLCPDALYCNGEDTCDDAGTCQPGANPCTDPLFSVCDEDADACVADEENKIYVAEHLSEDGKLRRMNLDGGHVEELSVIPISDWMVVGLQVDTVNRQIYWTHGQRLQGRIARANLDGTNIETIVSGLKLPRGLALDVDNGKVYWSDTMDQKMYRADLNGSGMEAIVDIEHRLGRPTLDLAGNRLYFGKIDPLGSGDIRRTHLDGSSPEVLITGLRSPIAVAVDPGGQKIYWVDNRASPEHIARANFDGTDLEILREGPPASSSGFIGIALNLRAGKLYWSDDLGDTERGVWWANLDGGSAERIYASPSGYNNEGGFTLALVCRSMADYALFQCCFSGDGGGVLPGCEMFDFGDDTDIDLRDVIRFLRGFTGP